MKVRNMWTMGLLSLGVAAMVGVSGPTLYSTVYAQSEDTEQAPIEGRGRFSKGLEYKEDHSAILADVLGISEEELQTAVASAREATIVQAVTDGKITQEQADEMLANEDGVGWGRMGRGAGHDDGLATALGITPEELQAAQEEVKDRVIAEAVASGEITQEEADMMAARQALQEYQRDAQQQEFEATVAQAVADGALTQEQADLILSEQGSRFFGHGMGRGQRGGMRGGHMDGGQMNGGQGRPSRGPGQQPPTDSDGSTPESSSSPLAPANALDL